MNRINQRINEQVLLLHCRMLVAVRGGLRAQELRAPVLSEGDLYQGMVRAIPRGRVIAPYGLEVTFLKTVHLIFPAAIRYVDLGSPSLLAGKAPGAENVLRVKAAIEGFERETNLGVICDDGSFYSFNVKYAEEPERLSVEMSDFLSTGNGNTPSNRQDIYFKELGNETPRLVRMLMEGLHRKNEHAIKHIGVAQFGVKFLLRGIYSHGGLLYFHVMVENGTSTPFRVDFVSFRVVDRKVVSRTAIQERVLQPVRTYEVPTLVAKRSKMRMIYVLEQFSLPSDKLLEVILYERGGDRAMKFVLEANELVHARALDDLRLKL